MSAGGAIIVTGASGFVGSAIVKALVASGLTVSAWSRTPVLESGAIWQPFDLSGSGIPRIEGFSGLIHCAYDFAPLDWCEIKRINVNNTLRLFDAAEKADVRTRIFISSMSAYPGCHSSYGRAKLAVEEALLPRDVIVLRPGLVYDEEGKGGIYGGLCRIAERFPVIPLVGTGSYPQYLVHKEDLAQLVVSVVRDSTGHYRGRPLLVSHPRAVTLRELMLELARRSRGLEGRWLFLPLPWRLIYWPLRVLETMHARVGFRSDSLIGLIYPNPAPEFESGFCFRCYPKA